MSRVGADGLVNHTVAGLIQGVSGQETELRRESQVQEMNNCIPHISRGILRRNPVKYVGGLVDKDATPLPVEDFFVYTYDRGTTGEVYLVLVGHRKWYIYNNATSVLVGSYNDTTNVGTNLDYLDTNGVHPKEVYSFVTVGDHTWISNNQIKTKMNTQTDGLSLTAHRATAVFTVKKTGNIVTSTNPTTGNATIEGFRYEVIANYYDTDFSVVPDTAVITGSNTYKTGDTIATAIKDALNVGHGAGASGPLVEGPFYENKGGFFNFIWNSDTKVVYNSLVSKNVFFWDGVAVGTSATTTVVVGIFTYTRVAFVAGFLLSSAYTIKRERTAITVGDPRDGFWESAGPVVFRRDMSEESVIEYNDSFGNSASYAFKGVVPSSDRLPESLPVDIGEILVLVDSSEETEGGEYWLKWNGSVWVESRGPGFKNIIDETTMPHTFLRADNGEFSFGFYGAFSGVTDTGVHEKPLASTWAERKKGDDKSAPEPGFIGKVVSDMFIHNNRLGILAEDAVVLSELSVYGNFFPTTVRSIPATDPIDLVVATSDVTGLKKAVSVSGLLLLFSDTSQFSLTSGQAGGLSPETAIIQSVSNYNYSNKAPARVVGNRIYFLTESGNGTQQFAFQVSSLESSGGSVVAESTSLHIPTYLPANIRYLQGHSILGYAFMTSPDEPNTIYVLNTLDVGGKVAQQAYHRWGFKYPIEGISVLGNQLNIVFVIAGVLHYTTIDLDVPVDHNTVSYLDDFNAVPLETFNSEVILSRWLVKDTEGIGTLRGRLQIRTVAFGVARLDAYKVSVVHESLFRPVSSGDPFLFGTGIWGWPTWWVVIGSTTNDDAVLWTDLKPFQERIYLNDNLVTISSDSQTTYIRFSTNTTTPAKGFALSTINYEGMFRQRSSRY